MATPVFVASEAMSWRSCSGSFSGRGTFVQRNLRALETERTSGWVTSWYPKKAGLRSRCYVVDSVDDVPGGISRLSNLSGLGLLYMGPDAYQVIMLWEFMAMANSQLITLLHGKGTNR